LTSAVDFGLDLVSDKQGDSSDGDSVIRSGS